MPEPDPYARWSLADRLQMLAFEARLALPRSLIAALWEAIDRERHECAAAPNLSQRKQWGQLGEVLA